MSNLHISSDFSGLDALIPQGRRVFVVIDSNLKPFFGLFERYELIPIQTSEKVKTFATVEYIIEQLQVLVSSIGGNGLTLAIRN